MKFKPTNLRPLVLTTTTSSKYDVVRTPSVDAMPPPVILSNEDVMRKTGWSFFSCCSVWSILSSLSLVGILSLMSAGSLLSVGSSASVLSFASTASVLSAFSTASVLSVASQGCNDGSIHVGTNCDDRRTRETFFTVSIFYTEEAWKTAASCTKAEYKSSDRPERCDYMRIRCAVENHRLATTINQTCKVRRKGSSTWRELSDKPSFKIKMDESYVWFDEPCAADEAAAGGHYAGKCPPGATTNRAETKKATFNNMYTWDGDVEAYETFRKYIPAPMAGGARIHLYRQGVLQRSDDYAMIETVDDSKFVEKWFGEDYLLYEVEYGEPKFERSGGVWEYLDDEDEPVLANHPTRPTMEILSRTDVDEPTTLMYAALSDKMHHYDNACSRKNNYFLVLSPTNRSAPDPSVGATWSIVPWGADDTFRCYIPMRHTNKYCKPVVECLHDAVCKEDYKTIEARATTTRTATCPDFVLNGLLNLFLPSVGTVLIVWYVHRSSK